MYLSINRVASMIYGRQPGILHPKIHTPPLPQSTDDVYVRDGRDQPEGLPSMNAFLRCTVRLYLVMDSIMEIFQAPNSHSEKGNDPMRRRSSAEILITVLKSDELLLSWHSSLPDYLRFSLSGSYQYEVSQPRWIQRCRIVLKNRFLGLRILLHRQTILFLLLTSLRSAHDTTTLAYQWPTLFTDFIRGQDGWDTSMRPESDLERPLTYLSAQICIQSAQQQIDTISISRPAHLTGAWWWDFHFKYSHLPVLHSRS
jgi:hypothetical protein